MHSLDNTPPPELDDATRRLLTDPAKRKTWVLYQVNLRGTSVAALGREAGVSSRAIYNSFDKPYPRMEKLVADFLGLKPWDIWPDRYDEDGLPNRRRGLPVPQCAHRSTHTPKATPAAKKCNAQKRQAA